VRGPSHRGARRHRLHRQRRLTAPSTRSPAGTKRRSRGDASTRSPPWIGARWRSARHGMLYAGPHPPPPPKYGAWAAGTVIAIDPRNRPSTSKAGPSSRAPATSGRSRRLRQTPSGRAPGRTARLFVHRAALRQGGARSGSAATSTSCRWRWPCDGQPSRGHLRGGDTSSRFDLRRPARRAAIAELPRATRDSRPIATTARRSGVVVAAQRVRARRPASPPVSRRTSEGAEGHRRQAARAARPAPDKPAPGETARRAATCAGRKGSPFPRRCRGGFEQLHALRRHLLHLRCGSPPAATAYAGSWAGSRLPDPPRSQRDHPAFDARPSGRSPRSWPTKRRRRLRTGAAAAVLTPSGCHRQGSSFSPQRVFDAVCPRALGQPALPPRAGVSVHHPLGQHLQAGKGWSEWQAVANPAQGRATGATVGKVASPTVRYLQWRVDFTRRRLGAARGPV
jgi:hypothetical protein